MLYHTLQNLNGAPEGDASSSTFQTQRTSWLSLVARAGQKPVAELTLA